MVQLYVIQGRIIALNILALVELSKYMRNEYNLRNLEIWNYGVVCKVKRLRVFQEFFQSH